MNFHAPIFEDLEGNRFVFHQVHRFATSTEAMMAGVENDKLPGITFTGSTLLVHAWTPVLAGIWGDETGQAAIWFVGGPYFEQAHVLGFDADKLEGMEGSHE